MASHRLDIYGAWLHSAATAREWKTLQRKHTWAELADIDSEGLDGMVCFEVYTGDGRRTPHAFVYIDAARHERGPHDLAETCAHEATHAAAKILDHLGQQQGDSEALAYLVGWITRWILSGIDPK